MISYIYIGPITSSGSIHTSCCDYWGVQSFDIYDKSNNAWTTYKCMNCKKFCKVKYEK